MKIIVIKYDTAVKNKKRTLTTITDAELDSTLIRGIFGLLQQDGAIQSNEGIWLSPSMQPKTQPYELRHNAHLGVAGVVFALSRFARARLLPPEGIVRVKQAIHWLRHTPRCIEDKGYGLHTGSAGISIALSEAIAAHIEIPTDALCNFIKKGLRDNLEGSDMACDAAGQGIANMYCFDRLQWIGLQDNIQNCVDYLVETQQNDGSWLNPTQSTKGQFNVEHQAEVAYFLSEFAFREQAPSVGINAERALNYLQEKHEKQTRPSLAEWYRNSEAEVALTFLRAYEQTGDVQYATTARHALTIQPIQSHHANLFQYEGLCSLGETYIEAFRILNDPQWLEHASDLAVLLCDKARSTQTGELYWLTQDSPIANASLMLGNAGVLHFLMRLRQQGELSGPPLLLDKVV